ncbi:tape measure protein [Sphingobacterium siyangense]|uniref:tape measure protein n=1 Tax=Sphingobacterium siyangense TaxID=459529 RepID=UPI003DA4A1B7
MSFTAIIEANIEQFARAINQAQARLDQFAETTGKKLAEIGQTFDSVGKSLSIGLTAPLSALAVASLKSYGDIESLKNGLTALTGSANEAGKQMARLTKLTDIPGLSLEALTKGSINLQTIGFSAQKAEKAMAGLGNAIALVGGGQQDFEGALYGLQQLANTEFPLGEDLNILKERLPQITPLLKEAFGTARTEELQKLKITSAQVVDTIITGLDKLPKAAIGFNGAFSQVMNAIKVSLAQLGEAIDKTFDVTGSIQRFKTTLQELTARFAELDPKTQKFILLLSGVAAAIGPVLVGIGAILQLAPLVGTAFAVVTGPIGLTVAAVAAATVAIIKHWDEIVEYFTNGRGHKFWDNISSSAQSIYESLKSIFNSLSKAMKAIWDNIGESSVSAFENAFLTILNIVSTVVNNITNILNILAAIFRGDWTQALLSFKKSFEDVFKGIAQIVVSTTQTIYSALASVSKFLGANDLGSWFQGLSNDLDAFSTNTENAAGQVWALDVALPSVGKKAEETKKPIQGLSDAAKKLAEEIANLKLELQGTLMSEWGRQLFDINNKYDAIVKKYGGNKDILGLAEQARNAELLRAKMGQILEEWQPAKLNADGVNPSMEFTVPDNAKIGEDLQNFSNQYKNTFAKIKEEAEVFTTDLNAILYDAINGSIADLGDALGQALASGSNVVSALGKSLLSSLSSVLASVGKLMIQTGTSMLGLQKLFANPFSPAGAALAIAGGVALVALAGAFKSGVNSAVSGGGYAGGYSASTTSNNDYSQFRGARYDNSREVVQLELKNGNLVGAIDWSNKRNNRLS